MLTMPKALDFKRKRTWEIYKNNGYPNHPNYDQDFKSVFRREVKSKNRKKQLEIFKINLRYLNDTLRKDAGCSSELDCIEQISWVSL